MTLADRARNSLTSVGVSPDTARAYVAAILDGVTNPDAEMVNKALIA